MKKVYNSPEEWIQEMDQLYGYSQVDPQPEKVYQSPEYKRPKIRAHFNKWGQFRGYSQTIDVGVALCAILAIPLFFCLGWLFAIGMWATKCKGIHPIAAVVISLWAIPSFFNFIDLIKLIF